MVPTRRSGPSAPSTRTDVARQHPLERLQDPRHVQGAGVVAEDAVGQRPARGRRPARGATTGSRAGPGATSAATTDASRRSMRTIISTGSLLRRPVAAIRAASSAPDQTPSESPSASATQKAKKGSRISGPAAGAAGVPHSWLSSLRAAPTRSRHAASDGDDKRWKFPMRAGPIRYILPRRPRAASPFGPSGSQRSSGGKIAWETTSGNRRGGWRPWGSSWPPDWSPPPGSAGRPARRPLLGPFDRRQGLCRARGDLGPCHLVGQLHGPRRHPGRRLPAHRAATARACRPSSPPAACRRAPWSCSR